TMETVVEVGMPYVLNVSSNITSVTITARKIRMISENKKYSGLKIPFRATSIIPLEKVAPTNIPNAATNMITLKPAALDPTAEFRKLTASLLTPTTRSEIASKKR